MHKALALILLAMAPAATPSPTEVVKTGIEQVVQAVQDFDASHPAAAEKRRLMGAWNAASPAVKAWFKDQIDEPVMGRRFGT